jgi:hypothetical protein
MKFINNVSEAVKRGYLRAGVGVAAAVPVLASAAPADPFDTVIASATDKVEAYAGALVGFAGVAVVFMLAIKYIKKIPRAG